MNVERSTQQSRTAKRKHQTDAHAQGDGAGVRKRQATGPSRKSAHGASGETAGPSKAKPKRGGQRGKLTSSADVPPPLPQRMLAFYAEVSEDAKAALKPKGRLKPKQVDYEQVFQSMLNGETLSGWRCFGPGCSTFNKGTKLCSTCGLELHVTVSSDGDTRQGKELQTEVRRSWDEVKLLSTKAKKGLFAIVFVYCDLLLNVQSIYMVRPEFIAEDCLGLHGKKRFGKIKQDNGSIRKVPQFTWKFPRDVCKLIGRESFTPPPDGMGGMEEDDDDLNSLVLEDDDMLGEGQGSPSLPNALSIQPTQAQAAERLENSQAVGGVGGTPDVAAEGSSAAGSLPHGDGHSAMMPSVAVIDTPFTSGGENVTPPTVVDPPFSSFPASSEETSGGGSGPLPPPVPITPESVSSSAASSRTGGSLTVPAPVTPAGKDGTRPTAAAVVDPPLPPFPAPSEAISGVGGGPPPPPVPITPESSSAGGSSEGSDDVRRTRELGPLISTRKTGAREARETTHSHEHNVLVTALEHHINEGNLPLIGDHVGFRGETDGEVARAYAERSGEKARADGARGGGWRPDITIFGPRTRTTHILEVKTMGDRKVAPWQLGRYKERSVAKVGLYDNLIYNTDGSLNRVALLEAFNRWGAPYTTQTCICVPDDDDELLSVNEFMSEIVIQNNRYVEFFRVKIDGENRCVVELLELKQIETEAVIVPVYSTEYDGKSWTKWQPVCH